MNIYLQWLKCVLSIWKQDTCFNIGSNDVSGDIEVDPNEFPLK